MVMFSEDGTGCEYIVAGKLSASPTCQQLGIPQDEEQQINTYGFQRKCSDFKMKKALNDSRARRKLDPFSPCCIIPLPAPFGSSVLNPACLRRRNERERDRVRCVNEGYVRLKEHLPLDKKNKRLSKVETLRSAIRYIKYLRTLLAKKKDRAEYYAKNSESDDDTLCMRTGFCGTAEMDKDKLRLAVAMRSDCSEQYEHQTFQSDNESESDIMYFSTDSEEA